MLHIDSFHAAMMNATPKYVELLHLRRRQLGTLLKSTTCTFTCQACGANMNVIAAAAAAVQAAST